MVRLPTVLCLLVGFTLSPWPGNLRADDERVKTAERALKSIRDHRSRADKDEENRVKKAQDEVKKARKEKSKSDKKETDRVRDAQKRVSKARSRKGEDRQKATEEANRKLQAARAQQNRVRQEQLQKIRESLNKLNETRRQQIRIRLEGQRKTREATRALQLAKTGAKKREAGVVRKPEPKPKPPAKPTPPPPTPKKPRDPNGPHVLGIVVSAFPDPPFTLLSIRVADKSEDVVVYILEETPVTYVEMARKDRHPKPGLKIAVWLLEGSRDRAERIVFSLPSRGKE